MPTTPVAAAAERPVVAPRLRPSVPVEGLAVTAPGTAGRQRRAGATDTGRAAEAANRRDDDVDRRDDVGRDDDVDRRDDVDPRYAAGGRPADTRPDSGPPGAGRHHAAGQAVPTLSGSTQAVVRRNMGRTRWWNPLRGNPGAEPEDRG